MLAKDLIRELKKRSPNTEMKVCLNVEMLYEGGRESRKYVIDTNLVGIEPSISSAKLTANAIIRVTTEIGVMEMEITELNILEK